MKGSKKGGDLLMTICEYKQSAVLTVMGINRAIGVAFKNIS